MDFGLAIIGNLSQEKCDLITHLSDDLIANFSKRYYGDDVESITIGIICVAPEFDTFFKSTRPKYTKLKSIAGLDGKPFIIEKSIEYSIKLNFDDFTNADMATARNILAIEIFESLKLLDTLKKKLSKFDFEKFTLDTKKYFIS